MLCSSFSYRVFIIFRPLKFKKRAKRVNELKYKQIPEVEKATRLTYIGGDKELFKTQDGNRYSARYVVMGDTNVFDLLPRPILIGDPKETLSRPGYVMISNRIF